MSTLFLPHLWPAGGWLAFDGLCVAAAAALARAALPSSSTLLAAPLLAGGALFLLLRALPRPSPLGQQSQHGCACTVEILLRVCVGSPLPLESRRHAAAGAPGHTHKRSFLGPARLRRAARPACQLCGG